MDSQSPDASADERERAPGGLGLVQDLINSYDVEADTEELPDLDALAAWLRQRGLIAPGDRLVDEDLERTRALREGLRALLVERAQGAISAETVAALNGSLHPGTLRLAFDAGGSPQLAPATKALDRALAELAAIIAQAALDGSWLRLKVCAEDTCRYAFYDRSKNRSGCWCSMAVCGNRAKARSYRSRHRPARAES